ncbi:MAG: hypothetical protein CSB47_08725 [Proteobacteria bacterium]|nr:MAG: hypothetical protein CSB47_08725 [Pseudomonadota bacterium]
MAILFAYDNMQRKINRGMSIVNVSCKTILRLGVIFLAGLLGACSTGGGGAFGTPAPNTQYQALSSAPIPAAVRRSEEGGRSIDPRVLADMRELASYRGHSVYQIGPSDLLAIKVFQAKELSGEVRVDQRGSITLPLIGNVRLAGLTQVQAEQRLAELLGANYLRNPQVSVFIKEFTNQRVTVEGEVNKQGVYPLNGQVTVLQAIALAGGLGKKADTNTVALFRKQGSGHRVFYLDLALIREGRANDPFVVNDDRIVVQRLKEQRVTVEGEVKKPGVFTFDEPTTVLQAIALSHGLTGLGAPDKVILFRREGNGEKVYGVNLSDIRQGKVQDPYVQGGDRIVVHRSNSRYWLEQAARFAAPLSIFRGWVN